MLPKDEILRRGLLPEASSLGPAMRVLTERQQLFVVACLDMGCATNHTQAARIAGYVDGDALKVTAHRLAHHPKIQAALLEEAKKRIQAGTVAATSLLIEVVGDAEHATKDRLKAAQMILDRGGVHAVTERLGTEVSSPEGRMEKVLRLALLAKLLGQDPRMLLGNLADAVEGDFKVLESVPEAGAG